MEEALQKGLRLENGAGLTRKDGMGRCGRKAYISHWSEEKDLDMGRRIKLGFMPGLEDCPNLEQMPFPSLRFNIFS